MASRSAICSSSSTIYLSAWPWLTALCWLALARIFVPSNASVTSPTRSARRRGGAEARRDFEHLVKAAFKQRAVFPPKRADAVVIGMPVRAEQPHRDVLMGEPLDAPAAKGARRGAVEEQPEQHRGRILIAARAPVVDVCRAQIQQPDRLHDEVDQMIFRHPVAQIRRQEQRRVVISVHAAGRHPTPTRKVKISSAVSPTGC